MPASGVRLQLLDGRQAAEHRPDMLVLHAEASGEEDGNFPRRLAV